MKPKEVLLAIILSAFAGSGCSHIQIDRHPLSRSFKEPFQIVGQKVLMPFRPQNNFWFVDIDDDGRDEMLGIQNSEHGRSLISISTLQPEALGGFSDSLRFDYGGKFDADTNGMEDLIFVGENEESIYILNIPVLNFEGAKIHLFASKRELLSNQRGNVGIRLKEMNPPDPTSVILTVETTFSEAPRHVISYNFPGHKVNFDVPVGGIVEGICRDDFSGSGGREILFGTFAASNGAYANGMDDSRSWLALLSESGEILYKKPLGEYGSFVNVSPWSFLGKNGQRSVFVVRNHYGERQSESDFVGRWSWEERENFPKLHFQQGINFQLPFFWLNPQNGKREVLFVLMDGTLVEVDEYLNIVRMKKLNFLVDPKSAHVLDAGDVADGPGPEFLVAEPGYCYILDSQFRLLASREILQVPRLVHISRGEKESLAFIQAGGASLQRNRVYLGRVRRNPVYYGFRAALAGIGLLVILGGVILAEHRKRRRREVLFLQQNVFRAWVLENLDTGVLIFDSSGKLHSVNRTARQLLGATGTLPDGDRFAEADISPQIRDAVLSILRRLEEQDSPPAEENVTVYAGDETRRLVLTGETIRDEYGRILGKAISIRDITETLRSHEMLAWAKIARQLAHEVKTPLASMLLAAEKLRKLSAQLPDGESQKKLGNYLQFIFDEIQHLRRLSESMMQLTDLEAKPFQPVDLNRLIREGLERVRPLMPENTKIHLELDEKLPKISGNPHQLGLALNNLLKNAAEAVGNGDSIRIRTSLAYGLQDDPQPDQSCAVVEISDSGKGIPARIRERIFEPYFSNRERGTGLGLAIVKKIVADHGGKITFESQEGMGTTFWIYFPAGRKE